LSLGGRVAGSWNSFRAMVQCCLACLIKVVTCLFVLGHAAASGPAPAACPGTGMLRRRRGRAPGEAATPRAWR
jgi:hypothetical protein